MTLTLPLLLAIIVFAVLTLIVLISATKNSKTSKSTPQSESHHTAPQRTSPSDSPTFVASTPQSGDGCPHGQSSRELCTVCSQDRNMQVRGGWEREMFGIDAPPLQTQTIVAPKPLTAPVRNSDKLVKNIVCLANSRKYHGSCIAGKEYANSNPGVWIRPVSDREHQEVLQSESCYKNGVGPRVLDVIGVPLSRPIPKQHQQENWLLDSSKRWNKVGEVSWDDLACFADPVGPLWINGPKSYHGINDRVPVSRITELRSSLRLIRVNHVCLSVFRPNESFGDVTLRVQGRFKYQGVEYRLRVTDPDCERVYLAKPEGEYMIGESYITVSLGEQYKDFYYKLIAAIITRDGRFAP